MSAGAVPVTLARPCSPGPLSVGARVLCPSLAHSPLQLSHRPRGVGRTQRVRAALAQGHEGGVAAIPSVRRALPYPAATPTPGWGRTSAKSRAGSPALSKGSRSVAFFFLLPSLDFRKKICGRGKEEMGGLALQVPALLVLIAALPVLETRSRYCRRAYDLCSCPEQR